MKKEYAGFLIRLIAAIIDGIIVGIPLSFVTRAGLIRYLIPTAYAVFMLGKYGATIGKMIFKIKVVKENGSSLTYSDALVRELSKILSAFIILLGYLWMLWDDKKQTWHDKIAKTEVVKA